MTYGCYLGAIWSPQGVFLRIRFRALTFHTTAGPDEIEDRGLEKRRTAPDQPFFQLE